MVLGTSTILLGGVPDYPFYGTESTMAVYMDEDAAEWGEDAVMTDGREPMDRLFYALLGIVLVIGGAMIVEGERREHR